jgi:hypothetical protein
MTDDSKRPTKHQRRDPAELLQLCPGVFEGLSKEEVEDRLELFRLRGVPDPFDGLERLLADTREPDPAAEVALQPILDLLLPLLSSLCRRHGQEAIAEDANARVEGILDSAATGSTRGEQRAAMRLRHPFRAVHPAYRPGSDLFDPLPPDGRKVGKLVLDPLRAIQLRREFREVQAGMEAVIPAGKGQRRDRRQALFELLRERFPALRPVMQRAVDVDDLTPGRAARIIFGSLRGVSSSQVDNLLAEAKQVVEGWGEMGAMARAWADQEADQWLSDPNPERRAYAEAYLASRSKARPKV